MSAFLFADEALLDRGAADAGTFGRLFRGYILHRVLFARQHALRSAEELLRLEDPILPAAASGRPLRRAAGRSLSSLRSALARELRFQPDEPLRLILRGWARIDVRRGCAHFSETAVADFLRASELDPASAWAALSLGVVAESRKDFPAAIAHCSRALELRPGWAWAHALRGVARWYHEPPRESVRDFEAALAAEPGFALVRLLLGRAWADLRHPRMIPELQAACRAAPGSGLALTWKGRAHAMLGERRKAASALTRAIRLAPFYDRPRSWRGVLRLHSGQPAAARGDLRRAAALNPYYATTFYHLAQAALELGDFAEGARALRRAAAIDFEDIWIEHFTDFQNANPTFARALRDMDLLLERFPRGAWLWAWKGQTLLVLKEYGAAIAALDRACELRPAEAWTWVWRAEAKRRLGLVRAAEVDFAHAAALDFFCAWAHAGLGACQLALDRPADAVRHLDRALELNPRCARGLAHVWRAEARWRLGETAAAAADMRAGLKFCPRWDWVSRRLLAVEKGELPILPAPSAALRLPQDAPALRALEEALSEKLRASPFDRRLYVSRGQVRLNLGDALAAVEDASRALDANLDPTDSEALLLRARAHRAAGDPVAARDDLGRLRALYPGRTAPVGEAALG